MERSNSELGEEYIAVIFATLYDSWPKRIGLSAESITGIEFDTELLFESPPAYPPNEWDVCSELFVWLEAEGYIRTSGTIGNVWCLGRTQLTHKAIEALKQLPDPINPDKKRTLIDAFVDTAKNSGKEGRNQVIKLGMTSLYKFIIS